MKKTIKTIIFLLIFCFLFCIVYHIIWLAPNTISYFYKEPKNSMDIVYIGASNAFTSFNTVLAYNLYGYTTGMLSTGSQPFAAEKYLIKEAQKYQSPSLYIIDISKAADDLDSFNEGDIRTVTDAMKFSKNRIDAINELLSYANVEKSEYINYYYSFLLYHNKWKHISRGSLVGESHLYKGYIFSSETAEIESYSFYNWKEEIEKLPTENEKVIIDLLNYIKENKLNVLFVVPKKCYDEKINMRLNEVINIIQRENFKIINFNKLKELNNIDFSTDLYNSKHLNVYGATKNTLYFSKYLKENYELDDHRNNSDYSSWGNEYKRFKKDFRKITKRDFDELLIEYDAKNKNL